MSDQTPDQEHVMEWANHATDLPGGIVVGAAAFADIVSDSDGEEYDVVVLSLVFQVGDGGGFLRQSFVFDPTIIEPLAEQLANPQPISTEENN